MAEGSGGGSKTRGGYGDWTVTAKA